MIFATENRRHLAVTFRDCKVRHIAGSAIFQFQVRSKLLEHRVFPREVIFFQTFFVVAFTTLTNAVSTKLQQTRIELSNCFIKVLVGAVTKTKRNIVKILKR